MKQKISLQFIFLLFVIGGLYGQNTCLSGINFIRNQEDVDAIIKNYPECEIIEGSVFIWGNGTGEDISNLKGFAHIKKIKGFLQLRVNPVINDLSGLSNLENIGEILYIQGNNTLTDLEGLNNIRDIGGSIFIGQNAALETLSGLDGVESINGELTIRNNDLLNDISALENIDPNSINSKDDNNDDLVIINNMSLSECSIKNLCELLDIEGRTFKISNNNSGCENVAKIKENCPIDSTCLPVAKLFNSQQEIDDFPIDYPHCKHILGDVRITESIDGDIINLNGLSQIDIIDGALSILNNSNLEKLVGLSNLDTIGRFLEINNNPSITSLSEFSNLKSVNSIKIKKSSLINLEGLNKIKRLGGDLTIFSNSDLISLDGIESLKNVEDQIRIYNNPNLKSIAALGNVKSADDIDIDRNKGLVSLDGLDSLKSLTGYLCIQSNFNLDNLDALSQLKSVGSYVSIKFNYDLVSIDGISNIDPNSIKSQNNNKDLIIYQNHALSKCNVQSICEILEIEGKTVQIKQNGDGCGNNEEVSEKCTTINKDLNIRNVSISPNPCFSHIFINSEEQIDQVSIVNIYGNIVGKITGRNHSKQFSIDVSNLNSGIYFIELLIGSSKVWRKILKK